MQAQTAGTPRVERGGARPADSAVDFDSRPRARGPGEIERAVVVDGQVAADGERVVLCHQCTGVRAPQRAVGIDGQRVRKRKRSPCAANRERIDARPDSGRVCSVVIVHHDRVVGCGRDRHVIGGTRNREYVPVVDIAPEDRRPPPVQVAGAQSNKGTRKKRAVTQTRAGTRTLPSPFIVSLPYAGAYHHPPFNHRSKRDRQRVPAPP